MSEVDTTYDVIVMGAGPVGENVADRAGRGGLRVALVERRLVGGECSFYACIPSKALLRPIHAAHAASRVRGVSGAQVHPGGVFARRDYWVSGLSDRSAVGWLDSVGIDLLRGDARLVGERLVQVGDTTYRASTAVVVATGTSAAVPPIPGLREAKPWTNIEATTAHVVPDRLVVLGGGVVAAEMAQVYAGLGSTVTVVERGDRLLARTEPFAGELVADGLRRDGVDVRLGVSAGSVDRRSPGGAVTVALSDGSSVTGDEVLAALGRTPATAGLGLEGVGATLERGYVQVDDRCEVVGVPGRWLYAAGDVNGRNLLTHMGKYQGRVCGDVIAARAAGRAADGPGMRAFADGLGAPQVVFTDPEVAAVGLTLAAAQQRGLDARAVDVAMTSASGAGLQADGYAGKARLVVDEAAGVVVGATFVGQDVADLVHAATVAVVGRVPLDSLWHAVPSFPSMSEVWLRLLEAYGL
ncbi:MAG TPA: NAD(P)/FAD-dependent oxidoreductase [Dermatophilaceae bacterium]|nr:NAD(P)/FAD-dependent oxidoreductase [Dermatophilaceae bacterium]